MRLLITGGLGFIGSNLVRHLLKAHPDYEIINIDAETYAGHRENLTDVATNPKYKLVVGRIEDATLVDEIVSGKKFSTIDGIINLAAESLGGESQDGIRPVVVNTILEHNSNELPWRRLPGVALIRFPVNDEGFLDLDALEALLRAYNQEGQHGNKRIRLRDPRKRLPSHFRGGRNGSLRD